MACWIWIFGSARSSTLAPNHDKKYFQAFTKGLALAISRPPVSDVPSPYAARSPSCQSADHRRDQQAAPVVQARGRLAVDPPTEVGGPGSSAVQHPAGQLLGLGEPGPEPVQLLGEPGDPVVRRTGDSRCRQREHLGGPGDQTLQC